MWLEWITNLQFRGWKLCSGYYRSHNRPQSLPGSWNPVTMRLSKFTWTSAGYTSRQTDRYEFPSLAILVDLPSRQPFLSDFDWLSSSCWPLPGGPPPATESIWRIMKTKEGKAMKAFRNFVNHPVMKKVSFVPLLYLIVQLTRFLSSIRAFELGR